MADIHPLPLLGHDLPLAADLRRQVRAKARVRRVGKYWSWRHDCGDRYTSVTCIPDYVMAVSMAAQHVKQCCRWP